LWYYICHLAGGAAEGLADLKIEARLLTYIHGGKKPASTNERLGVTPQVDANSKASRVLEGDFINVAVTTPGI
jgi:hypothetical protein